jgi:hypothetical protein
MRILADTNIVARLAQPVDAHRQGAEPPHAAHGLNGCFRPRQPENEPTRSTGPHDVTRKHTALFGPFHLCGYRPQHSFVYWLAAICDPWEEEKRFLDVRGQVVEVHDLRHPGLGDVADAGQFGKVLDFSLADQPVTVNGQGHEAGDTRNPAGLNFGFRSRGVDDFLPTPFSAHEINLAFDGDHAAASFSR